MWGACRTGPEWILLGSVRLCRLVLLGRVGFCWVALNRIWFCWVPLGRVGFCWVALGSVGLCWLEAEPQRAGPAAFLCAARWNEPSRAEPSGAGPGHPYRSPTAPFVCRSQVQGRELSPARLCPTRLCPTHPAPLGSAFVAPPPFSPPPPFSAPPCPVRCGCGALRNRHRTAAAGPGPSAAPRDLERGRGRGGRGGGTTTHKGGEERRAEGGTEPQGKDGDEDKDGDKDGESDGTGTGMGMGAVEGMRREHYRTAK